MNFVGIIKLIQILCNPMTGILVRRHRHTHREGSHAKIEADKWRNAATSPGMPKTTWQTPGAWKTQ